MMSKIEFNIRATWRSILIKGYSRFPADVSEFIDDGHDQRDSIPLMTLFGFAFGIARDHDAGTSGLWTSRAKRSDPVIDLTLKLDGVNERTDFHGAEKMSDPFADRAGRNLLTQGERRRPRPPVCCR